MAMPALLKRLLRTLSHRKLERARRELSLAGALHPTRAARRARAALAETDPRDGRGPHRQPSAPARRRREAPRLLEQMALDLGPDRPRWTPSRLVQASPHRERILEYLEFARKFFPELERSEERRVGKECRYRWARRR